MWIENLMKTNIDYKCKWVILKCSSCDRIQTKNIHTTTYTRTRAHTSVHISTKCGINTKYTFVIKFQIKRCINRYWMTILNLNELLKSLHLFHFTYNCMIKMGIAIFKAIEPLQNDYDFDDGKLLCVSPKHTHIIDYVADS